MNKPFLHQKKRGSVGCEFWFFFLTSFIRRAHKSPLCFISSRIGRISFGFCANWGYIMQGKISERRLPKSVGNRNNVIYSFIKMLAHRVHQHTILCVSPFSCSECSVDSLDGWTDSQQSFAVDRYVTQLQICNYRRTNLNGLDNCSLQVIFKFQIYFF